MPITQSRMIALLHAALDYEQALAHAEQIIRQECDLAGRGKKPWKEAADMILLLVQPIGLLTRPIETAATVAVERSHWKKSVITRNDAAREHQRQLRNPLYIRQQTQGPRVEIVAAVKTTAPPTLDTEVHLDSAMEKSLAEAQALMRRLEAEEETTSNVGGDEGPLAELDLSRPGEPKDEA